MMISVALCTYNGEKYILQQLKSLSAQILLPGEVIISDDGSNDRTLDIVEQFSRTAPFRMKVTNNASSMGTVQNFSKAISLCNGNYIALCDQDDVWQPDKLAKSIHLLKQEEGKFPANTPIMVHTDLMVVDKNLNFLHQSMMMMQKIRNEENMEKAFKVLLIQNYVTGCTIVFNQALKTLACPFPQNIVMHDWWLALLAAATGQIFFLNETLISYRQHGNNQIGADQFFSVKHMRQVFSYKSMFDRLRKNVDQNIFLQKYLEQNTKAAEILREYLRCLSEKNILNLFRKDICCQSPLKTAGIYFFLFLYRNKLMIHIRKMFNDEVI